MASSKRAENAWAHTWATLGDLLRWMLAAPPGTMLEARTLAAELARLVDVPEPQPEPAAPSGPAPFSWRLELWRCPEDTRLNVDEVCEALDRSSSWLYKRTGEKSEHSRIPHRRDESGALVFLAGEVRAWVREHEETIVGGPSLPAERLRAA